MAGPTTAFGPFAFDRSAAVLLRDGKPVDIGQRGIVLLKALIEARGETVTKAELMESVWPDVLVEEGNLTVQIAALRKALGKRPEGGDWIATIPRVGYRLVTGEATRPGAGRPAIAVLPFANLSGDPEQDYLADGVVEDLITALSRFHTFAVVSRNSSFVYKGRAVDAREAARELGVRYLLEGSVRRWGDRIRVTAQLIEGMTGEHLWADKLDGAATDIFDFKDTITDTVIGLIEPQIRKAEIDRARRKRPENLDAWDLYVQALPLVHSPEVPNYSKAIALLDHAVAIDSNYAPALALAAWAHEKRHTFGGPELPQFETDAEVSLSLAARAVDADPDEALALVQLGYFRIYFRQDFGGIELVRRALAINPNNVSVLEFAAVALLYAGNLDEVIACGTRALMLSPGAPNIHAILSHIAAGHNLSGNFEAGVELGQRCVDLAPTYVFGHLHLAFGYANLGRIEEAHREIAIALTLRPDLPVKIETDLAMRSPERRAAWVEGLRKAGLFDGERSVEVREPTA